MIKIAQIGCGYWGPNLLRNFYKLKNVEVKYVAETDPERINYVRSNYANINIIEDYRIVLGDKDIDAVVTLIVYAYCYLRFWLYFCFLSNE